LRVSPSFICEQRAGEKFAVLLLVEPRALDVEELETRHETRQCERVDRELRDRLVGARIRFVVEDVHRAVAHLQKVDVAGDCTVGGVHAWGEFDAVLLLECGDVLLIKPDRNLDCEGRAVVGEHKVLWGLVAPLVVADGPDDEGGGISGRILLAIDDDARDVGEFRVRLRGASFGIVIATEEVMRTGIRDALKEIDNWCEARITEPLVVERASARGLELRPVEARSKSCMLRAT
jgi:hypothetical protein